MEKQISLLTLSFALLTMLVSNQIHTAAELPAINAEACKKLHKAAKDGDIETAQQALTEGANINGALNNIKHANLQLLNNLQLPLSTPLNIAARSGNLPMVQFLLELSASVDAKILGNTPLVDICGHTELPRATMRTIITELLTHKANINIQHNRLKTTPLMRIIGYLKDEGIARQLILAGADVTITDRHEQTAFDLIETPTMRETFLEACAINEQVFQRLPELEKTMRTEMLKNLHIPLGELATNFSPFYANQGKDQPTYDLLNARIAEQWTPILEKLEIERLLNQPDCLSIAPVAGIACDYLFSPQKQ